MYGECAAIPLCAMIYNCKNQVKLCEDQSFTLFHIRSSYMIHFVYHFIVDSFLTGTLEPTNDQLPTSALGQIMNSSSRDTISFVEIGKQLKVAELLFTLTTHFLLKEGVT